MNKERNHIRSHAENWRQKYFIPIVSASNGIYYLP